MLSRWYARRMEAWERELCFRATNRVVRPFEWGLDWIAHWPEAQRMPRNGYDPETYTRLLNDGILAAGDDFFAYAKPREFAFDGEVARFPSPWRSPFPENNTVHLRYFPARQDRRKTKKKAVVVLPHWNSSPHQHVALCRGFQKLGISAVRVSLPYHDARMPAGLERADYAVSANIGRTLDATRQAVIDTRASIDWLESHGYERFGIVGTSLGSCYAFLASSHDARIGINVFNHCSAYFADVVWTGLSTRHIRQSLEENLTLERLRKVWNVLNPSHYMDRFAAHRKKSLLIYSKYDSTFLPEYSRTAIEHIRARLHDHHVVALPCGHYTLGEFPFKYIDGFHICSFMKRNL